MGLREFLDQRMDWQFDRKSAEVTNRVGYTRWRRGPVTFYRVRSTLPSSAVTTEWYVYAMDDFGLGVHLPDRVCRLLDRIVGE